MARDDSEPLGDLADQATDHVFAAEQAAIAAALAGRDAEEVSTRAALPPLPDEPRLDLGDVDDSDDAVHAGGDDIALSATGAPRDEDRDPDQLALDDADDDAFRPRAHG